MERDQFPVKPAFAMTIHYKSQGQTFDLVGIGLSFVFSHGQLYVAFSRVKRKSSLKVFLWTKKKTLF